MFVAQKIYFISITIFFIQASISVEIDLKLPYGFLIGSGSSAFQVEGAWNVDGKQESVMDYFAHTHKYEINDNTTADLTTDSYNKYKEDVKLMKNIGFDTYRFSISWSRILPNGYPDVVNHKGLIYYHNLIDELLKNGIQPIVTIYHWDHPQKLEKMGGWLNERMAYYFADYARLVFKEFGDRVKIFTTINEPRVMCDLRYRLKFFGQKDNFMNLNHYTCTHHMLKAHALAYHIYDQEFRPKQGGIIGLNIACKSYYSKNLNDYVSNEVAFEFLCGHAIHPIFSRHGDYSPILKSRISWRSKKLGYKKSKLPTFSREWVQYIKGSADYLGLSHFTSSLVEPLPYSQVLHWENDEGLNYTNAPNWPTSSTSMFRIVPKGFGDLLRKIKDRYDNPPVYILENGISDHGELADDWKMKHLYSYLDEMLIAIKRDGCNVRAYTVWSFLDSFEFYSGYRSRFGLIHVDFNNKNRTRTPKKSALWFKSMLRFRQLIPPACFYFYPLK